MVRVFFVALMFAGSLRVWAGPPFVTDDPVPVEVGHWEVYAFSSAIQTHEQFTGTLAGFDINYGTIENLHLHVLLPLAFTDSAGGNFHSGVGDIELGAKYRIVNSKSDQWWPQIAIYPAITLPTGDDKRGLGAGHVRAFLPVWLQKDFGKWTACAGSGYEINPGAGNQNYMFFGLQLQRQITEQLMLGGEVTHTTADVIGGDDASGFNIGGLYDITSHYHFLISAGRGFQNIATTDAFQYYVGLQWTN